MSEINYSAAVNVFNAIEAYFKSHNLKYDKDVENLTFKYSFGGDDLPMSFTLFVDAERELIRLLSFMPFQFAEDKRVEGAVAVCVANYGMVNGCFGYDISDGTVFHKLTVCYKGTDIGDDLVEYIVGIGLSTVEKYNDRFLALNKGYISIADFLAKE